MRRHRDINPQPGVSIHHAESPLIVWPCYEPVLWASQTPGRSVSLSEEDCGQHVCLIGSTGCGKTTLILAAIQQLLPQKIGLLILDAKQDGMVEQISEMATRAGRGADLAILGPHGTHVLDIFGALRTYDDVQALTEWLMLATDRIDVYNNPYWQNTSSALISAALTLLVNRRRRTTFADAVEFMRNWFVQMDGSAMPKRVTEVLEAAKRKAAKPGASPQLLGAVDHASVWKHLDPRTRSNLQSCLLNVLRPLLSSAATRSFDSTDRLVFDPRQVATNGKLCIVSVNALTHPELAKFFMRLARRQFFDAVQARLPDERQFGSALIADEFPLIIQPEDADQLATLRSKRCFVLAATQGLGALDEKVGPRLRRSILLNFNTIVCMRTREEEAGEFASLNLGTRSRKVTPKPRAEWEDNTLALLAQPVPIKFQGPVCPPGALGQLQPHQAYVMKADGNRTLYPVWFVPWFEMTASDLGAPHSRPSHKFVNDANQTEQLMQRCGVHPVLSPEILMAAATLDAGLHDRSLSEAREFFRGKACMIPEGLESLPAGWLAGIPGILWSTRKQHWTMIPYMIRRVGFAEGVLLLEFTQEQRRPSKRLTAWNQIRVTLNRCIYPSRWRPLLGRHRHQLRVSHPELRSELAAADLDLA